jgi:hypothetical protein
MGAHRTVTVTVMMLLGALTVTVRCIYGSYELYTAVKIKLNYTKVENMCLHFLHGLEKVLKALMF